MARPRSERKTHYLGLGFANLVAMFTRDAIVHGSDAMTGAPLFLDGIGKNYKVERATLPGAGMHLVVAAFNTA